MAGAGCADFEGAHGVIFELDLARPQHWALVLRYRQLAPAEVPIRVVATPEQAVRYASALAGVEVWTRKPNVAELDGFVAQVEAADR